MTTKKSSKPRSSKNRDYLDGLILIVLLVGVNVALAAYVGVL